MTAAELSDRRDGQRAAQRSPPAHGTTVVRPHPCSRRSDGAARARSLRWDRARPSRASPRMTAGGDYQLRAVAFDTAVALLDAPIAISRARRLISLQTRLIGADRG